MKNSEGWNPKAVGSEVVLVYPPSGTLCTSSKFFRLTDLVLPLELIGRIERRESVT